MTGEKDFIASLRPFAGRAARDLRDDAALLEVAAGALVLTFDMIVEGVHYLASDPPEDVAWKLVAVNLSDLAAKGARPIGILLGYALGAGDWDARFVAGLGTALASFQISIFGGDTVAMPSGAPRTLALTAIGTAGPSVPSRSGARAGDHLWVSGSIGDAGAGLRALQAGRSEPAALIERYRNPRPRLEAGQRLAPMVGAMMDVSDGLLIDASRMAEASDCRVEIAIEDVPLSQPLIAEHGDGAETRLEAIVAGDDYELLFAAAPAQAPAIHALAEEIGLPLSRIGEFHQGTGLALTRAGSPISLPDRLGYEHRG